MKYNEFKHRIYDVIMKYGFKKENKEYVYRNKEVMIIFGLEKSSYGNHIAKYGLGINPKDILENWNIEEPTYYDISQITFAFFKTMMFDEIELDDITETEVMIIIEKLECFLQNDFLKYTTKEGLIKAIIKNQLEVDDYIMEFWGIKI